MKNINGEEVIITHLGLIFKETSNYNHFNIYWAIILDKKKNFKDSFCDSWWGLFSPKVQLPLLTFTLNKC